MFSEITRRTLIGTAVGAVLSFSAAVAQAQQPTFALVQINQQALFFNQMNEGAQKAAEKAGAKLVIFNANNDPAAQNNAIETYIPQKVDGHHRRRDRRERHHARREAAADAGIPVVAVDAILPDGPQKAQIGVDNDEAGAQIGKYFAKYVDGDTAGRRSSASSAR